MRVCWAAEGGKEGDLNVSGAKGIRWLRGAHWAEGTRPGLGGQRGFPHPPGTRMEVLQGQHFRDTEMQEMTQTSLPSALFSTNWSTAHILKEKRLASLHLKKRLFGEIGIIDSLLQDSMGETACRTAPCDCFCRQRGRQVQRRSSHSLRICASTPRPQSFLVPERAEVLTCSTESGR